MRTNEERIEAMHSRAQQITWERRRKTSRVLSISGVAACLAFVICMSAWLPGGLSPSHTGTPQNNMYTSAFGESTALGYIVIEITAFLLGAFVTIFCYRLKKWRDQKEPGAPYDRDL